MFFIFFSILILSLYILEYGLAAFTQIGLVLTVFSAILRPRSTEIHIFNVIDNLYVNVQLYINLRAYFYICMHLQQGSRVTSEVSVSITSITGFSLL